MTKVSKQPSCGLKKQKALLLEFKSQVIEVFEGLALLEEEWEASSECTHIVKKKREDKVRRQIL